MWEDAIVEEVRNVRRKIGAEYGHDLRRIVEDLRRSQVTSSRKVVTMEPRPPRQMMRKPGTGAK
jgi:hypothetical protein